MTRNQKDVRSLRRLALLAHDRLETGPTFTAPPLESGCGYSRAMHQSTGTR